MDLVKIGKFIANLRKEKNLTQEELAEKLFITDRAVSKWERGISLPDADKMLDLCNIFGINVNELLIGEKINMKDYNDKTDKLLVELARQEEDKNKKLMAAMWVILIVSSLFYASVIYFAYKALGEGFTYGTVIVVSTIIIVFTWFFALKLEVDAGYYECKKCHHKIKPTYMQALFAPHMSTTRYLKCLECGKRTWHKKSMTKE